MSLIMAGVIAVSFKQSEDTTGLDIDYQNLWIAVLFALATGASFATTAWIVKKYIKESGFTPI
jgi:drug/metabolite transporter (DMT)-like permease